MSARGRTLRGVARATASPGEIAWIAAIPFALLLLAAVLVLAVPLGDALLEPPRSGWWPFWGPRLGHLPEPEEHAAYLFALLAPAALCAAVVLAARRGVHAPAGALRRLVGASGALLVAFVLVCLVAQRRLLFGVPYEFTPFHRAYFTPATLVVAAVLTAAGVALLHSDAALARVAGWTRESRGRALAAGVLAALATAIWVLPGLHTDASVGTANPFTAENIPFWLDEPFAVLDGRYPLVDFHAQYAQLIPYLVAVPMKLIGSTIAVWTATLVTGSALALLAVHALLRRVTRSALLALGLYLPVLATGFFTEAGPLANRHGPVTLLSMFPMRYGGAYLLAWLTARHLDGAAPRRLWPLAFAGGLVLVNNVEFGLPALAGTLLALALHDPPRSRARAGRLAGELALGLLTALAAVALLTLVVAGSLPHLGMALTFVRIYGAYGFGNLPMPDLGFHLAIYVTFAAALVCAVVRAAGRATEDRLLTAMLAWAGVFGLGAGAYYVGRSLPQVLISVFSAWALALALLLVVIVRALARRPARRPALPELAVLAGFGLAVCSLAQTPLPWTQVQRLQRHTAVPAYAHTATERFVAAHARRGERVVILGPLGHRIAYDLHLDDVSPYSTIESMPLERQLSETIAVLRREGGRELFLPIQQVAREQVQAVEQAGFHVAATGTPAQNAIELVDGR
ncbi:MAG TPA: hypothetical protein VFV85_05955 [Conexibacter sp.]|nr:hypothetical protein [Conexibacter sp.]